MREIKFRAKERYSGTWVYGALLKDNVFTYILTGNPRVTIGLQVTKEVAEVLPETVGQYTGLKDKNGKMIFEGDVVRIEDFVNATVKWREDIACWTLQSHIIGNTWGSSMLEVIGNIHDQKEDV